MSHLIQAGPVREEMGVGEGGRGSGNFSACVIFFCPLAVQVFFLCFGYIVFCKTFHLC